MKRYEFVEHTSDIAVCVYGRSLKDLFVSAALALESALFAKIKNKAKACLQEVVIEKRAEANEDLLKEWLDELLFDFLTKGCVLHRIKSLECDGETLCARVLFDSFDKEYYEIKNEVKAVTYHELKVEKTPRQWQAHIIFDV